MMAIGEPIYPVYCDECLKEGCAAATATARGGFDDRHVQSEIESWGWLYISDVQIYCEYCRERIMRVMRMVRDEIQND